MGRISHTKERALYYAIVSITVAIVGRGWLISELLSDCYWVVLVIGGEGPLIHQVSGFCMTVLIDSKDELNSKKIE